MKKIVCFVVVVVILGLICEISAKDKEVISPKNFGQGVYYFSVLIPSYWYEGSRTSKESKDPELFGRSLAYFKALHPNLKVTGITTRMSGGADFGVHSVGYWVNFEEK